MTEPAWRCQHVTSGTEKAETVLKMHSLDPTLVVYVWHVLLCKECDWQLSQVIRGGTINATPEDP